MAEKPLTLEVVFGHLAQEARDTRADIRSLRDDIHQLDRRVHGAELILQGLAERRSRKAAAVRELSIAGVAAVIGRWSDHAIALASAILPHASHHH